MKSTCIISCMMLTMFTQVLFSQSDQGIHFNQIAQKKVRHLLKKDQLQQVQDFESMVPSCYDDLKGEGYSQNIYSTLVNERPEVVWTAYKSLSPKQLGLGRIINFGVSYSRKNKKLIYPSDDGGSIEEGQIIVSALKYLGGFVKLAVAQEITEINEQQKFITFCYMENGKTLGSQKIMLHKTAEGFTEIIHETFYKSKSRFRDRRLYPGLHEKTVAEIHENVRRQLSRNHQNGSPLSNIEQDDNPSTESRILAH